MNRTLVIGMVVLLVILVGGYFVFMNNGIPAAPTYTQATTTTQSPTPNPVVTPTPNPVPTVGAPIVVTNTSVAPTNSTAVVTGSVVPNGAPTTYWYQYGTTASLGSKTAAQVIGSGFSTIPSPGYITGLSKNTTYYFELTAQNSYGTVNGTAYSFSTNNNPPEQGTLPVVITNSVSSLTPTSATLNAHVNPHSSQTTYWFEYGTTADLGQISPFQSGGSSDVSTAVSGSVSGLNAQTKYYFRVDAQNQYGTVTGATGSFTTPGPVTSLPPVVTTLIASPVATTSATLRGTANSAGTQTKYWFEYSTDAGFSSALLHSTPQKSAGANMKTVSVEATISPLQPLTTYYYRTVAQNAAGTVRGDALSFKTN